MPLKVKKPTKKYKYLNLYIIKTEAIIEKIHNIEKSSKFYTDKIVIFNKIGKNIK